MGGEEEVHGSSSRRAEDAAQVPPRATYLLYSTREPARADGRDSPGRRLLRTALGGRGV